MHQQNAETIVFERPLILRFATHFMINSSRSQDGWDSVKICAFAHTYFSTDFVGNRVRVVWNQRGYTFLKHEEKIGEVEERPQTLNPSMVSSYSPIA